MNDFLGRRLQRDRVNHAMNLSSTPYCQQKKNVEDFLECPKSVWRNCGNGTRKLRGIASRGHNVMKDFVGCVEGVCREIMSTVP